MKTRMMLCALAGMNASMCLGADGIRVVTWNITHYRGDRAEEIGTAVYGTWEGKSLDPDVICLQEMMGRVPVLRFVDALNDAPGSPGDWVAAPVYTDPRGGHHTALVYRTSKLSVAETELVSLGGAPPQQPRNVVRFDLMPAGYEDESSILTFFPLHYKAGYEPSDLARKLVEARIVREHIETLPENRHIILGADLNIRHSTDPAYEELNGVIPNTGVLWDPISTPGTWNNTYAFRNIHTQDPTGHGGMDDRLDQILLSPSLLDGSGFDYDGAFPTPWDLSTTEDPNHSHRAWGNDGTRYNNTMRTAGNSMVGTEIAEAIAALAVPNGHIPVYLDLNVAGKIRIVGDSIQLGKIPFGESRSFLVRIGNDGDTDVWGSAGIGALNYSFGTPESIETTTTHSNAAAGAQLNPHVFMLDSSRYQSAGSYTEYIRVHSDDPDSPEATIEVQFEIMGCNAADIAEPLGTHSFMDIAAFIQYFEQMDPVTDLAEPAGVFNFFDLAAFLDLYRAGCDL